MHYLDLGICQLFVPDSGSSRKYVVLENDKRVKGTVTASINEYNPLSMPFLSGFGLQDLDMVAQIHNFYPAGNNGKHVLGAREVKRAVLDALVQTLSGEARVIYMETKKYEVEASIFPFSTWFSECKADSRYIVRKS